MTHKFACWCGQRISATPDLIGTVGDCPECRVHFIVPAPPAEFAQAPTPELAELLGKVVAFELSYRRPMGISDEAGDIRTIHAFFAELDTLAVLLEDLLLTEEIARKANKDEQRKIREAVWEKFMGGTWKGTVHERNMVIFGSVPELRPKAQT
jgi:hypothetical protein